MTANGWQFWIDRGGTFTDIIGRAPDGRLHTRKLLSHDPERYADAAVAGIEAVLRCAAPGAQVSAIKMGTTVATNALLERAGAPTALAITAGFGDALQIGYQDRPELFALQIRRPEALHGRVLEVAERINAQGEILQALDEKKLRSGLEELRAGGWDSLAICFLHGYRYPQHEIRAGEIATELGFRQVSLSHATTPLPKLISRGDTTVADAYLSPLLRDYLDGFRQALADAAIDVRHVQFMQSNGGLVAGEFFRGKDSVLSGPAAGVVGMAAACGAAADDRLIGFDMGGTSTDVSLYAGHFEIVTDNSVAGVRLRAPMIRLHTVAAGGGSVLRFDQGRFQVGPTSAGAVPGPACYGRGGPLALTDANLLLGRLVTAGFPRVFGPEAKAGLDSAAAAAALAELTERVARETGQSLSAEAAAEGFVRIAVDNMANAIKTVSTQRGQDPRDFSLCCFGGAGGQHACEVAAALGIRRILIHPLAGVLSAYGMGAAPLSAYRQAPVGEILDAATAAGLESLVAELRTACEAELSAQGVASEATECTASLQLRVTGADTTLAVNWEGSVAGAITAFNDSHRERFGFAHDAQAPVAESLRVTVSGGGGEAARAPESDAGTWPGLPASQRLFCDGRWQEAAVLQRETLAAGDSVDGPAIVVDANATTVVMPGWQIQCGPAGLLELRSTAMPASPGPALTAADPVLLELFNNHCMNVAEQMGAVLENTAHSVNIKERRDFSCALFDADAQLVANAPHIPVHLGSMGESVRAVTEQVEMQPGDSWMLNDPYTGGTHLPDITVVTPFFGAADQAPLFLLACRAHHADIGGITPGSMPARSRHIDEEGVRFQPFLLVRDGRLREAELRSALAASDWPARNPDQNLADLRAQLAANERGIAGLRGLVSYFSRPTVEAYLGHVQDNAEAAVRAAIRRLGSGEATARLDDGSRICVSVNTRADTGSARVDFSGTSGPSAGNLNAPRGITQAAVLYVFRCLVAEDIPLNAGCLRPLEIRVPPDSLLCPNYPAAVAGGNVETSQCIANALFRALGLLAAGQGTMNNLSFGNERHQYYETLGGGAGAGDGFAGASAVHTHMTNSRLTDPEVLEERYPVLVREFAIRRRSGGRGAFPGGDGMLRAIEFLEPMQAALLSNHRETGPPGLAGGGDGKRGLNMVLRADDSVEYLPGIAEVELATGDVLIVATPGGGAFGSAATIPAKKNPTHDTQRDKAK